MTHSRTLVYYPSESEYPMILIPFLTLLSIVMAHEVFGLENLPYRQEKQK